MDIYRLWNVPVCFPFVRDLARNKNNSSLKNRCFAFKICLRVNYPHSQENQWQISCIDSLWFPLCVCTVLPLEVDLRAQNTLVRIFECFKPNSPCTTDGWGIWPVLRIPFATLRRTKTCFNLWIVYIMLYRRTTPLIDNCPLLILVRIILNASLLKSLLHTTTVISWPLFNLRENYWYNWR